MCLRIFKPSVRVWHYSITIVAESWNEVRDSTLNSSWGKLLPGLVEKNQVTIPSDSVLQEVVQSTINVAQEIGGEGFSDMQDSDVLSMVSTDRNQLTASDIEEILEDAEGNRAAEKNVEESPEPALSIRILSQIISTVQNAIDDALAQDPILTRSLKFKLDCESALMSYKELVYTSTR
ncbi:hypothetical protein QAD02_007023 [Eretmocerus hayati]|uniref:Uncharacterized protein n=1 Tax=Eretmocerus hayati TaxID=131215 RepID=A0ACC2N2W9_9HYME|nr:hypothetical protein QAD02_007023 [Eretmocerus hayati]